MNAAGIFRHVVAVCFLAMVGHAYAAAITDSFTLNFSATQSLFRGGAGPGVGFHWIDRFGPPTVGVYFDIGYETGTVHSEVNGTLQVVHPDAIPAGTGADLAFSFLGSTSGGNLASFFGLGAEAGIYLNIELCLLPNPLPFGPPCLVPEIPVNQDFPLIDQGLLLAPTTNFTPQLGVTQSANDVEEVLSAGGIDIGPFALGLSLNVELNQTISLTLDALRGSFNCTNLDTADTYSTPFVLNQDNNPVNGQTDPLSAGTWECTFADILLPNTFQDDAVLGVRPAIDYIVGSWPPPGQGLFLFPLPGTSEETFPLEFNTIAIVGSFLIEAIEGPAVIPEPDGLALLVAALGGLALSRRRTRRQM